MVARYCLQCAPPKCWFLVHADPECGGCPCKTCHWMHIAGRKRKKSHGDLCVRVEAPAPALHANPTPPEEPFSWGLGPAD